MVKRDPGDLNAAPPQGSRPKTTSREGTVILVVGGPAFPSLNPKGPSQLSDEVPLAAIRSEAPLSAEAGGRLLSRFPLSPLHPALFFP